MRLRKQLGGRRRPQIARELRPLHDRLPRPHQSEYLALLREAGVTVLADVRRNPIGRKKGFSKRSLAEGCPAHGIRYEHLPELGVASEKRKALTAQADVDALFEEYAREWLPTQSAALAKLRAWLDAGERLALTCFEREAKDCHRHCVAEVLEATARLGARDL